MIYLKLRQEGRRVNDQRPIGSMPERGAQEGFDRNRDGHTVKPVLVQSLVTEPT